MKVHLSTSENDDDWKPLGDRSGDHDTIENALESLKAATTTGDVKTGRRYLIEISDGATPDTETETQVDERRQLARVMQAQTALQAAIDQLPEAIRTKVRDRYLDEVIQEQIEVVTDEYNRLNRGPDSVYTMLYRPCTQLGTLPPKVVTEWTRVPAELAHAFPDKPVSRLRNSWGWRLGAVLNSPGKHPFALDRRLDAGSGGPAARREVKVGLFRRVADRASEHRWVTDAGRAPRGVAGGALVMSPGVRAGRR